MASSSKPKKDVLNSNTQSIPVIASGTVSGPSQESNKKQQTQALGIGSRPDTVAESEDEDDEEQRTLFVANLDHRITEELLFEVFVQAGPIERVRIPRDGDGRQKTFGFVSFVHRCSPPYAMNLLQGLSLYHKSIVIKFNRTTVPPPLMVPLIGLGSTRNVDSRDSNFSSNLDTTPSTSQHQNRRYNHNSSNQTRPHTSSNPFHQAPQHWSRDTSPYNEKRHHHNRRSSNKKNTRNPDRRSSRSGREKNRR